MAQHGKDTLVYHGEYAFATHLDSVDTSREIATLEDTTFGDNSRTYVKGQKNGTASISGFYDNTIDDALEASYGGSDVPVSIIYGSTAGTNALLMDAIETTVTSSASVTELIRVDAEYQPSSNGIESGVLLLPSVTTSGVVDTTSDTYDRGATATTGGCYANLHVLSAGASGTLDVTISTNTNNFIGGTTVTPITFTQVTTSETSEYKESTTSPKRYIRVAYVTTGASSAYTFVVTFGHNR